MQHSTASPPFRLTAEALRTTTERLALELREPQSSAPDWTEFEWGIARAVATMHGISVLLARRLRWRGPPRWQDFLAEQLEHGLRREVRIEALLTCIDELVRRERVAVVALKGSALLRLDLYAPGERPMGDVDLLAHATALPAITRALQSIGFRHSFSTRRHNVFSHPGSAQPHNFGEHIDNPLKIEVHTHVAEPLPMDAVDITRRLWPADARPGINRYANLAGLLAHLALHAAGNMRAHALRLLQLEDISRLVRCLDADDWQSFLEPDVDRRAPWWALPALLLARRDCGAPVPEQLLDSLRAGCPPRLARAARRYTLTEVSWSNLRIAALPGIEWSRSFGEMLRFARTRVAPSRVALDELSNAVESQPHLGDRPWYTLSHGARIARWLVSRPPRVQTMFAVEVALGRRPPSC